MKSTKNLTHIGSGGCHDVYLDTTTSRVTKVPNIIIRNFLGDPIIHTENLLIAHEYLGSYLLDSEVHIDDKTGYREEREYIENMRFLRFSDLEDKEISRQFYDIIKRNRKMYEEKGRSLDIFGLEGILSSMTQEIQYFEKDTNALRLRIAGYKMLSWVLTHVFRDNKNTLDSIGFSNIIIEEKNSQKKLRITDSTLTHADSEDAFYLMFSRVVNHGNNIAMERVFGRELLPKNRR